MNKTQHISSILFNEQSSLNNLYKKAVFSKKIDRKLKKFIDFDVKDHFQLSNIEKNVVTIVANSPSWATRLHYNIPKILDIMNNQLNFKTIKTVRIKVKNNF
tara:strand:- start:91 stop:396 length:306 start_codon:yes stop_codon:yes gene_type:complete